MTTICPLGPSATAPVVSIMRYFRDEVEAMIPGFSHAAVSAANAESAEAAGD
jgi:hypothetical protein